MRTQMLCTFTKNNLLVKTINRIADSFDVINGKIFVLENVDNKHDVICSYGVSLSRPVNFIEGTILVHRKKDTNTLYTINALNELIISINNGVLDKRYPIDWENYSNMLLVTGENGIRRIKTKLVEIVSVDNFGHNR